MQALWVAHLTAGPSSVVSHGSAARLWELEAIRHVGPNVSVPHGHSPAAGGLAVVHRTRHLDPVDVAVLDGLPVTTPARTLVDVAGECGRSRLRAALDAAHFDRKASLTEVGEAALRIGGSGRRGTVLLCRLLDDAAPGDALAQSVLERMLGDLLRAAGIERFSRQFPLPGRGEVHGFVDTFLDDADVIVEADGRRWHSRQAALRRDNERVFAAQQVGVMTVRLLHEHLTGDLEGWADGLRRIVDERRPMVAARRAAQASRCRPGL